MSLNHEGELNDQKAIRREKKKSPRMRKHGHALKKSSIRALKHIHKISKKSR